MNPNVVTGTLAGVVMLGVAGAGGWGLFLVFELLVKSLDKNTVGVLISSPLVLFVAYLVGNGYLELRQSRGQK